MSLDAGIQKILAQGVEVGPVLSGASPAFANLPSVSVSASSAFGAAAGTPQAPSMGQDSIASLIPGGSG